MKSTADSVYYMEVAKNLSCGFNCPPALKSEGKGDDEVAHGLPPYNKLCAYLTDKYPMAPVHWMRSQGSITSYFVPVIEDAGMWLDLNQCSNHQNDVAVVVSVQGINAVTGLPCKDPQLEQYKETCPKHKEAFGPNRFCKQCNYKWPKQNYLCTTGTPGGSMWLDGFRTAEGVIRQYLFTQDKARGVAKAIIGEDRVFAIGVAFFLSKQPKPPVSRYSGSNNILTSYSPDVCIGSDNICYGSSTSGDDDTPIGSSLDFASFSKSHKINNVSHSLTDGGLRSRASSYGVKGQSVGASSRVNSQVKVQKLEVAAGAKINQHVYDDPNDLAYWAENVAGILVINYCNEEDCEKILAGGMEDVDGSREGFLAQIPAGN